MRPCLLSSLTSGVDGSSTLLRAAARSSSNLAPVALSGAAVALVLVTSAPVRAQSSAEAAPPAPRAVPSTAHPARPAKAKPSSSASQPTSGEAPAAKAEAPGKAPIFDMGDVVVTGALEPVRLQQAPVPVQVVTRKDIEARHPIDAAEALTTMPGVNVLRYGGLGSITSLQIRGSGSENVLVLQDGRPLNQPSLGGADISTIPVEQIDRIEVIRGPFSALYGGTAMSGVVQLLSRKPKPDEKSTLTLLGGGMGTTELSATLQVPLSDKVHLQVSPTLRATDGNRPGSASRLGSGWFRLDAETGGKGALTITGGMNEARLGVPGPQPAEDPSKRTTSQRLLGTDLVSTDYDQQRRSERYLQVGWHDERWTARAWHNAWTTAFRSKYFVDPAQPASLTDSYVREATTGVEARYRIPHLEHSALTLGGLYERAWEDSTTDATGFDANSFTMLTQPATVRYAAQRDTRAFYLEEALVLDRLSATLGVRADQASGYAGQLSPRLNLLYRPTEWLGLRGGWGRGFRAPTLDELYYPSDGYYAGNSSLRPQRSTTTELGAEVQLGKQALLRATWFGDDVRDQITNTPTGPMGLAGPIYQPDNLNRLRKSGVEAQLLWNPTRELTFDASWSRLHAIQRRAEVTDANLGTLALVEREAANVPKSRTTLSATYRAPGGFWMRADGWLLGDRSQYYASYDAYPAVSYVTKRLPSTGVLDLTVGQKLQLGKVDTDVFLKVTNVFNERYSLMFDSDVHDRDYPASGRAVYLGIRPRF